MVRLKDAMAWHATPVPDLDMQNRDINGNMNVNSQGQVNNKGDTLFPHDLIGQKGLRSHVIDIVCNTY